MKHFCGKRVRDITGTTDTRTCDLRLVDNRCPMPDHEHLSELEAQLLDAGRHINLCYRLAYLAHGPDNDIAATLARLSKDVTALGAEIRKRVKHDREKL